MACCCCITLAVLFAGLIYLFNRWYRRDFISDFSGKYVFITGTDSGFGRKLAIDLDSIGVYVYAGCLTQEGATKLKNEATSRLKTVPLDVTKQSSVEQAKSFIENDLPTGQTLWGVVNNAGIVGNISFELSTLEDYRKIMEVNYFGCIRVTETFEQLIKKSKGRFVQVASMFGRGCVATAPYTCSKWAIEPYTDELRRYMRRFGVKVCTIEPGFFGETGLTDDHHWEGLLKQKYETLPEWKKAEFGKDFITEEICKYRYSFGNFPLSQFNTVNMVTEAMTHALGAKHPKTRYLVGYDTKPYIFFTCYTPDWFLDGFLRLAYWSMERRAIKAAK